MGRFILPFAGVSILATLHPITKRYSVVAKNATAPALGERFVLSGAVRLRINVPILAGIH